MYKYYLRPEYKSKNFLIEIFQGVESKEFVSDFFNTIKIINPNVKNVHDLWMNDEIHIDVNSDIGSFTFSKDIWDLAFVMTNNNQECLFKIDSILNSNEKFEKIEINVNDYL